MLKGVLVALVALGMPMGAAIAATTATTLVTSDQATVYGQLFTLTAKVTPSGGGVATGTVTFTDETNAVLGSAALNESGVASLDISTLAVGIHSITATFPGNDGGLEASTSPLLFQVVAKAETKIVFTAERRPDPCQFGLRLLLKATVTAVAPGSGQPIGAAQFKIGDDQIAAGGLVNGQFESTETFLGKGTYRIDAYFLGDSGFNKSAAPSITITLPAAEQVNTHKSENQNNSSVAALTNGGFVVTWESFRQDGDGLHGIFGQRYDVAGNRAGNEFHINTTTAGQQMGPSVAGLADGGFVVVWQSVRQDGSGYGIYGQRYGSAGQRKGNEFRINTTTSGDQKYPSISVLSDGSFVVVWFSGQPSIMARVMAQHFSAGGAPLGQEIKVAGGVRTNFGDPTPKVASLADGGFVIVWIMAQYSNTVLFGQRYSSTGVAVGGITEIAKGQSYRGLVVPNAVGLKDGGFVVTWGDYSSPYPKNPNSFGQRFTAGGQLAGAPFRLTASEQSYSPVPTALADGGFVVLWGIDTVLSGGACGIVRGIFGQRYDHLARRRGKEFMLEGRLSDAGEPSIAGLHHGGFIATWTDKEAKYFFDYYGIFQRRFAN